ncbi:M23 family metallopeptidase [Gleimia sp. 6138-11-ORH1]|uniref:M23 family metallopeptidase n=1 Tax=Gleimia sp. 6138-11-ORH1 TaxID=2973937 RepID=UPI00216805EC|nr:M23 family metallopeptidase [Gleimia sp. 6138-11-ORH1]MCS4484133.1 M23 family metallopeptidase [Gleimia sp. 6138-11-ORH1]
MRINKAISTALALLLGFFPVTAAFFTANWLHLPASAPSKFSELEQWRPPTALPLRIGREYDPPEFNWLSGHRGVDLCPAVGSVITAPTSGTVIYAGKLNDRDLVSIQLPNGLRTSFEPLKVQVSKGQQVKAGDPIGTLVAGHENDCLHWGVRKPGGKYLNPLQFLVGTPRLLPWQDPPDHTAS